MIKQLVKRLVSTKEDNLLSHAFSAMPFKDEIALVDIGAAGDIEPRWKKIEKHLVYYGFEPDIRSYKELEKKPELVRTMSVKPPKTDGKIRLVKIGNIDLQPCGGTHVKNTSEIGSIIIGKIENKGKMNRRVNLIIND